MMANIHIYNQQAKLAAEQGANLIVFPEDGLYGVWLNRSVIRPYLEPIPDPQTSSAWIPCTEPGRVTPSDILTQLSCIARNNSLYVVANMGDIQPCDVRGDDVNLVTCPPDGHYQYNTDVVFDTSGQLLARYHKRYLFGETQFDIPPVERVSFYTPFGRFGVFTCFDILFYDPAVALVEQGVQNVVFPTAWMDSYPLLDAVGFHSAWARRNAVTLLAANLQMPDLRFSGSGIYSPSGPLAFYYNRTSDSSGKLIISDVAGVESARKDGADAVIGSGSSMTSSADAFLPDDLHETTNELTRSGQSAPSMVTNNGEHSAASFPVVISKDLFEMVEVNEAKGRVSVCKGGTCCSLSYARSSATDPQSQPANEYFAFGAFQGVHESSINWYFEACLLVRCTNSQHSSCGKLTWDSSTIFSAVTISGNFSTNHIYPEVLVSNNGQVALTPSTEWQFTADVGTLAARNLSKPLLAAALYTRDYTKDPELRSFISS